MKPIAKLILSFSISFFCFSTVNAQKYKVKGETIFKDDLALGTVTGKGGLMNASFIIYDLKGEKVVTVYRDEYRMVNPLFGDRYWYNVRFEDTGKEMFLPMAVEFSIKSVLNKTFATAGINIDGGFVKNQDEIISKFDIKDSIINDTTYFGNTIREAKRLINETPLLQRDRKAQCTFNYVSKDKRADSTFTKWNIYQNGVLIGSYLQRSRYLYGKENYTYVIYRNIEGKVDGKEVPLACGEPDAFNTNIIKFYTITDNKERVINMQPGTNGSIVSALIAGNYF